MLASMSTVRGVTIAKSSPSFFFGRGVEPSDGAAAASGSSPLAARAAASFALTLRLQPMKATAAARPKSCGLGKPGMRPMRTSIAAPSSSALGCAKIWLTMSTPRGLAFSEPTRVTMTPDVMEISSAGIWPTRPSPIVRMPKRFTHQPTSCPNISMPMRMPPMMLIDVMMMPAMASPFTNFIAPSIAP